jgi:type II secretory pathway pseudopilin PulG
MRHAKANLLTNQRLSGFSLVETSISTLLVGILLVASVNTIGMSIRSQTVTANLVSASALADSLMSEILTNSYREPGSTYSFITRESGESGGSKANYDDVDDYDGWQEQPPQYRDSSGMLNLASWKRKVIVEFVTVSNGSVAKSNFETNLKRVTIEIYSNGIKVLSRESLISNP